MIKNIKKKKMKRSTVPSELTFSKLRAVNVKRCNKHFHKLNDWSPTDWGCALAGEVGELCNFLKKARRGENVSKDDIAKEIGDVQCYLDLIAARLKINLAECVIDKFNEVSARKNCKIRL